MRPDARRPDRDFWLVVGIIAVAALVTTLVLASRQADSRETPSRGGMTTTTGTPQTVSSPNPTTSTTQAPTTTTRVTEPQDDSVGRQETLARTSTTRAARSRTAAVGYGTQSAPSRTIGASAYSPCSAGQRTATGHQVRDGIVASVTLPMGSRWRVVSSSPPRPEVVGRTFLVDDTGGPRATFDVWLLDCQAAVNFGRPTLQIVAA